MSKVPRPRELDTLPESQTDKQTPRSKLVCAVHRAILCCSAYKCGESILRSNTYRLDLSCSLAYFSVHFQL